ncbi:MAG: P-loop NTPase [Firmicutes bacterium]|nr:P-loop NTPase [Bacillota bacterium]
MSWQGDQATRLRQMAANRAAVGLKLAAQPPPPGLRMEGAARVVAVAGGKGGVGKSTLAANIGIALAQRKLRVLLLDADLGLGNADLLLGITPHATLVDLWDATCPTEQVITPGPAGIGVIAGASGLAELARTPPGRVQQLVARLSEVDRQYDLFLLDVGAGIGEQVLAFTLSSDLLMVVTTPEPTALMDAYSLIKAWHLAGGTGSVQVVANMVRNAQEGEDTFDRLQTVSRRFLGRGLSYLGSVQADPSVPQSVRLQQPVMLAFPNSRAAWEIRQVAARLLGQSPGPGRGFGAMLLHTWDRLRGC